MEMKMKMMTNPLQVPGYNGGGGVVGLQALLLADTAAAAAASFLLIHHPHPTNHLLITRSLTPVLPPPLPPSSSTSTSTSTTSPDHQYLPLLLQSCHFCHTKLSPLTDVYMYRGDQGFCSTSCRDKQVKLDEIKETEESNLLFHLKNSYHANRRRQQLKAAPLLEISSTSNTVSSPATGSRRQGLSGGSSSSSSSIPRRRPISQYYNRPLPLPPHQRLVYHNKHRR